MVYFTRRYIDITFTGQTTVKLTRHRVSARIRVGGEPGFGTAEVAIYGMSLSLMNQLATFGQAIHPQRNNNLKVEAGDEINGMSVVFDGTIAQAWADFQSMPDVPFHVVAQAGLYATVQKTDQDYNSYSGSTDVSQMMGNLAQKAGLQFENNGVSIKLDSPYHFGSPLYQAKRIWESVSMGMVVENGVLAIWPENGNRAGDPTTVSRDTGMVGYPTFTDYGVLVKTEFRHAIKYGTQITIQSDLTPANGQWSIRLVDYDLQSLVPRGHWFVSLGCMNASYNGPLIPN